MSQRSNPEPGGKGQVGGLIVGFVYLNVYIIVHQLNVASRHFAVALNIPVQNIGIYFTKIDSFRVLLMTMGSGLEYLIYTISGGSLEVRKYVSIITLSLVSLTRVLLIFVLYYSKRASFHAYVILNADGLFFGFFQMAILALTPQHTSITNLSAYLAGVHVFLVQKIVDLFLYKNAMLNIKIQCCLYSLTNIIAIFLWIYYTIHSGELKTHQAESGTKQTAQPQVQATKECNGVSPPGKDIGFLSHLSNCFSQFFMFGATSFFKDFLFPGVLPYALLDRDKCHVTNLIIPIFFMLGPLAIYCLQNYSADFKCWSWYHNFFWLLIVPQIVVFVYSMIAIHTTLPSAKPIRNSQIRILFMTLTLLMCYNHMTPLSFVGVANYVYYQSGDKEGSTSVITLHNLLSLVYRFFFSKLSVGYNDTRLSLGYHLPRFRPNHRMRNWNAFWYVVRNTFKATWRDILSDFTINIQRYI